MTILLLDGGGTKLRADLYQTNKLIHTTTYGPCNLTLGYDIAVKHMRFAIIDAIKITQLDGALIAAAGVWSHPHLAQQLAQQLTTEFSFAIKIISDIQYHYHRYFLNHDGGVINLGTGTSALFYKNNQPTLYYGFGPMFDEPGCGYDIGRKLLGFLSQAEVQDPHNSLYLRFLADYQWVSIRSRVTLLNQLSNEEVAALAKWMLSLPPNPELKAEIQKIIDASFAKLITWLSSFDNTKLFFIGGIINHPSIQAKLSQTCPGAQFNIASIYSVEEIWNMLSA